MDEKKQPRIKILVACHKADPNIRQDDIYMPIQVGKALHPELDLGFQCDNTGDNISEKNGSYCELTALYWAWKNLKDIDIYGLAHYRRYFKITESEIYQLCNDKKIILAKPVISSISNYLYLVRSTSTDDVAILLLYIKKRYPDYLKSTIDYLFNNNRWIAYNMFIADKNISDKYFNWLFKILLDLEKYLKPSPYSRLRRIYGYLGEVLLPIYCKKNDIEIIYKDVLLIENETLKHTSVYNKCRDVINTLSFKLSNIKKIRNLPLDDAVILGLKHDNITIK